MRIGTVRERKDGEQRVGLTPEGAFALAVRGHQVYFERGAGETLACGTGACAAVVAGIRLGLLDACVDVDTRGGALTIEWDGARGTLCAPVLMTGPATTVFDGEIDIPESP